MKGVLLQWNVICKSNLLGGNGFTNSGGLLRSPHDQFAILKKWQYPGRVGSQTIADILLQAITGKTTVVRGILCFKKGVKILFGAGIQAFGDPRGIAIDIEVLFYFGDDGP